jgi:DNA processing protein
VVVDEEKLLADEALAILASLGFTMADWQAITRLGGPIELLRTKPIKKLINEKKGLRCDLLSDPRRCFDKLYEQGVFLLSPWAKYSRRLFRSHHAPLVFFARGAKSLLNEETLVSVVGSRQASTHSITETKQLVEELVKQEIVVVSGGATGIDEAAHLAALNAQKNTIVIAGISCECQADRWGRLTRHQKNLLVIYPFGPFLPQGKFMFVERNRYVASIADAVVIVVGKIGSGTSHTAQFAAEEKTPLFAIPGLRDDPLAFVPNQLIAQGLAEPLFDFSQFALSMMTKSSKPIKKRSSTKDASTKNADIKEPLPYLLQVISEQKNSVGFDELLAITGKSFTELQQELFAYELAGRIVKRGSLFMLIGN